MIDTLSNDSYTCNCKGNQRWQTACKEMVDFESLILARSKVIHNILGSEGSDSEIMSDCDTESVEEEEDRCRTLEDVIRY